MVVGAVVVTVVVTVDVLVVVAVVVVVVITQTRPKLFVPTGVVSEGQLWIHKPMYR